MFTVVQGDNWLAGLLVRPSVGTTDTTYVVASYTHPKARCQGMQRMLLGMVERELRPLRLVRQANATTADDRVQLNIKLGFATQEWATAFVRSDTACGVMPSLLCEDGGDCVAMGKLVHQHSTSDKEVSEHDGHALDSDDGNSVTPACVAIAMGHRNGASSTTKCQLVGRAGLLTNAVTIAHVRHLRRCG